MNTLQETATVTKTEGNYALVAIIPKKACGSCQTTGQCGTQVLTEALPVNTSTLKIPNTLNAKPGDTIYLSLSPIALLMVSLISYILPLITMFIALAISSTMLTPLSNTQAIISSILGLAIGFTIIITLNKPINTHFQPKMQAITQPIDFHN